MKIKHYMEEFIRENYQNMSQREIAEKLGNNVTPSDIQYWLRKNNLYKKKYMFSSEAIDYMIDNYMTMSYKEIAEHLNLTERQVRGKLNNMGYTKLRKFNKDYFHNIDSELKAYFLGFIFADGWVVYKPESRNYEFGMELHSKDKYILDALNNEIGGVHNIYHDNPKQRIIKGRIANCGHSDCLRIYSKDIVEDLIFHGVVPNKTHNYQTPLFPEEYFFDFLRGYIDGDGCYYITKSNTVNVKIVCASSFVLEWIQSVLNDYDIKTNIYHENELKHSLNCMNMNGVEKLLNLLYHDKCSLYLTRKYNKIKYLLKGRPC